MRFKPGDIVTINFKPQPGVLYGTLRVVRVLNDDAFAATVETPHWGFPVGYYGSWQIREWKLLRPGGPFGVKR